MKTKLDNTTKEIFLVFPGKFGASGPQIPLSLLTIAGFLIKSGYKVQISDLRIDNFEEIEIGEPLFVGISSMSGPQISFGLDFARRVRRENPNIPIVWGGVHPSLLPEQTVANEFVDVVVRGEGEITAVELANQLYAKKSIECVKGITFKKDGRVLTTPPRNFLNQDSIPIEIPYDLLKLDRYPSVKSGRFHMQTSRGCPGRCGFCYNSVVNHRIWRGKSAEHVLDELTFLFNKFPNLSNIDIVDDNFFVDRNRVESICNGILDRQIDVKWRANCRFDYLAKFNRDFIHLLDNSGCVELDFGGESGSERFQSYVTKDVTYSQMLLAVEKLRLWAPKIEPFVSWLSGLPDETVEDLYETFDLMDEMSRINPKTQHYAIFVYTPFPSPMADLLPVNFRIPQSLEEWAKIQVFHFSPPWHSKKYVKRLHTISAVSRYAFYPKTRIGERGAVFKLGYGFINKLAKFRWKHRCFGFPLELEFVDYASKRLRGFL